MKVSLLNQASIIDPYVYTGYIHNIHDLFSRYGLAYYSVRFGLILPAQLFSWAFGVEHGYLALRYALAILAAIPLYVLIKRCLGIHVAILIYCALIAEPIFDRSLFWDHPDSVALPYLLAGICVFSLDLEPSWIWNTIAGCLFSLALNSNAFTISIIGLFLLLFTGASLVYRRPIMPLARKLFCTAIGSILICLAGSLYYYRLIGIWNIFTPTISIIRWLSQGGMENWRFHGYAWIGNSFHVLILPGVTIYCLAAWKFAWRQFLTVVFCGYVGLVFVFYYVHQFLLHGDILQLPYYVAYSVPAVFLGMALVFGALWSDVPKRRLKWLLALGLAGFLLPWLLKAYGRDLLAYVSLRQYVLCAAANVAMLLAAFYPQIPSQVKLGVVGVATVLTGLSITLGLSSAYYAAVIPASSVNARREWDIYRVAYQFMDAVPKLKDTPGEIRFWYRNVAGNGDLDSIQSTYLWGYSRSQQSLPDDPGMPFIGAFQQKTFADKQVKYLGLLAHTDAELQQGVRALSAAGFLFELKQHRRFVSGDYQVYWQLVEFSRR